MVLSRRLLLAALLCLVYDCVLLKLPEAVEAQACDRSDTSDESSSKYCLTIRTVLCVHAHMHVDLDLRSEPWLTSADQFSGEAFTD